MNAGASRKAATASFIGRRDGNVACNELKLGGNKIFVNSLDESFRKDQEL